MTIIELIEKKGQTAIANICRVSQPAVFKWSVTGRLPRTEWTGETNYAEKIFNAYGIAIEPFKPEQAA